MFPRPFSVTLKREIPVTLSTLKIRLPNLNIIFDDCYPFNIKKDVVTLLVILLASSFMRGAKCYGKI